MLRLSNIMPREKWIERISAAWREQVPSIFETGNLLEAAKAELKHGEWMEMIKEALPFSRQTANKLMAIARNDRLRNDAHARHLPPHWPTLYELTRLTEEQFDVRQPSLFDEPFGLRAWNLARQQNVPQAAE